MLLILSVRLSTHDEQFRVRENLNCFPAALRLFSLCGFMFTQRRNGLPDKQFEKPSLQHVRSVLVIKTLNKWD